MVSARKHAHYFRNVAHLTEVDVYRVLDLFGVTDQALGHAIKKLLAPGGRGAGKDFRRDVQEAIDTLTRRLEMLDEDSFAEFDADEPEFFSSLATGDMELQAEAQHAATAPVVIPPAPDYLPDSVVMHVAGNDTLNAGPRIDVVAALAALDVVAANDADDWWIEWGGGECPVPVGTQLEVRHRGGAKYAGQACLSSGMLPFNWHIGTPGRPRPDPCDIIAYRVVRSA